MRHLATLTLLLALLPGVASSSATREEIEAGMRRNLPARSGFLTLSLTSQGQSGGVREAHAEIYWRRFDDDLARVMLRRTEPSDIRGTAVLAGERAGRADAELIVYLPELDRVKRVRPSRLGVSLFGTNFSYEDLAWLRSSAASAAFELVGEQLLDGRPVWVLAHQPAEDVRSVYERVVSYVDQQFCLPTRTEFYSSGDRVHKVLRADPASVTREGQGFVPRELQMQDLRDRSETRLEIAEIHSNAPVAPELFTRSALDPSEP